MKRDEVLAHLSKERAEFDRRIEALGSDAFNRVPAGHVHSPGEILFHVTAYEELIVERLRAARTGEITAFDRDRIGWEAFNERIWREAAGVDEDAAKTRAREVFAALVGEVSKLTDEDLNGTTDLTRAIDPEWLKGRALWELIAIDGFDHYAMHFAALDAALAGPEESG